MESNERKFEDNFFLNETNRFVGSGGEILLKKNASDVALATKMEIGDILIGIGVTHLIESLDRAPGLDSFRSFEATIGNDPIKMAFRAFEIVMKEQSSAGFNFSFSPLTPSVYSNVLETVSEGMVKIHPDTIPNGTIIMSFVDNEKSYSLSKLDNSPGENWRRVASAKRHWNVGIGKEDDFWAASFPSDDINMLTQVSPGVNVGTIRFGLSLLSGDDSTIKFREVECVSPKGYISKHHFCLTGVAAGTKGLNTFFPIGLRTMITFHPVG